MKYGNRGTSPFSAERDTHLAQREIRASFSERTVRVYQAYSSEIADVALAAQTFRPPFKRGRMTWIKPSFAWMMYRSGFGTKEGQERILGIDILRSGFEWALAHSNLTEFNPALHDSNEAWKTTLRSSPVRIQWDPERNLKLERLAWRTIQIGLGGAAVDAYLDEWITGVYDLTSLARDIDRALKLGDAAAALERLPRELLYPLPSHIAQQIGCSR